METIKSYLEAMFANMPNTPEVKKAKAELLAMMEDKYNELIADGESENTAVGTVISEFGNLDELAEDLGVTKEVEETHAREEKPRRFVSIDEVESYFSYCKTRAIVIGIGVFLCITSVIYPIIFDFFGDNGEDTYGVVGMFVSIAIAVGLFVFTGVMSGQWDYLSKEPCQIDMNTAKYAKDRKNNFKITYAICITVGVMLCAICWLPVAIIDLEVASASLFVCVGIGVFLFIASTGIMGGYDNILKINDEKTISGSYAKEDEVEYINKTATIIMEVYWPTVTCLYLMISFVTMDWGTTWIIWVVAAVLHKILNIALQKEED
ncbi:MAG: permease prefix domain 1-containing protein [Pseudobutyrivibrio sp.]|nr:permease prefix domain 1-containing protein [Pseudobutyrivibrio sp.]